MADSRKVQVTFQGKLEKDIPIAALAFDAGGKLVARAPVGTDGTAELPPEAANAARVVVAPVPQDPKAAPLTLRAARRLGAVDVSGAQIEIPPDVLKRWLFCRCNIQGHVVRPVTIGGVTINKPVCHARVHIYEVDPWPIIIFRLPDDIIRRLRDELFVAVENPPFRKPPLPDPPPFVFDTTVRDLSVTNLAKMQTPPAKFQMQAERPMALRAALETRLDPLPVEARVAFSAQSTVQLRSAMVQFKNLILPYFCWWPWIWPYFLDIDEIAVVDTDEQGFFHYLLPYLCGDRPDLYFRVEYSIGHTWVPVYSPPVACHVWWNYPCGTDVTLTVTDPRVPWCGGDQPPLPGKQVAWLLIGNDESVSRIQTSGANEGLTANGWEFGGSLEPHIWFGDDLRVPDGDGKFIDHYRLSYRRLGSTADPVALDHTVVRHFAAVFPDGTLTFKPFVLGPDPALTDIRFKIRPQDPPVPVGAVSASWSPEVDARSNTASGYFLTHLLDGGNAHTAAGTYEIFLDLYFNDGTRVNWTAAGVAAKTPDPSIVPPYGIGEVPTFAAPLYNLIRSDYGQAGAGDAVFGMRVVVQVDNNQVYPVIETITGTGLDADNDCGFYKYTPGGGATVTLAFQALQERRFATFSFRTDRGPGNHVGTATVSGRVGDTPVTGFVFDAGMFIYTKSSIPVADLLGGCENAAFSETLSMSAMITDGWTAPLYSSDAVPHAFALAKK